MWDQRRPGFLSVDRVAHGGGRLAGGFLWSLTYTGLGGTWTEGRAVWNKGCAGVLTQTQDVAARRPFALRGVDFAHGGEWRNWHRVRYWQDRLAPVQLTRSRPYPKDDHAHVEPKNWRGSRQGLGSQRPGKPGERPAPQRPLPRSGGTAA